MIAHQVQELVHALDGTREHLLDQVPKGWPALREVLSAALPDPLPPAAALPLACCVAVGGRPAQASPVACVALAINLSLRLLDDIQDRDRPGAWWAVIGPARAQ